MGIPVIAGREFGDEDYERSGRVAIVGRTFAERFWPGVNPIGQHVKLANIVDPVQIIGVGGDVKQFTLGDPQTADLYVPLRQMPATDAPLVAARMYWVLHASRDPLAVASGVRKEIASVDADIATSSVLTLDQVLKSAVGARRFNATLLGLFGPIALLLAAVGVYAVTAFTVGRRTREIGIRMAFGATHGDVVRLVLTSELPAVGAGLAVGLVMALAVARTLSRTLFRVDAFDPWTFAVSGTTLAAVAVLATYLPVRQSASIDPTAALRTPV
jgi:putative ABC transport system permease protein